jgi:hypothetical protein
MERHRLDVFSLLAGLLFVTVAVLSLADLLPLTGVDLRLLGPVILVLFGLALVLGVGKGRDDDPEGSTDVPAEDPTTQLADRTVGTDQDRAGG